MRMRPAFAMGAGMETSEPRKPPAPVAPRSLAFGQGHSLTWIDRFGFWLSTRRIRAAVGDFTGLAVADLGCGYEARFARSLSNQAGSITVTDLALASDLKCEPGIRAIEGRLPECLMVIEDRSIDAVICNSVIEHLTEPLGTLSGIYRICAPGGVALINVPTWRGKFLLEFAAFRLGVSAAAEMDDHKMYYDPRELWPLLVRAGFRPRDIRVFRHKFGLNTFAICRKPRAAGSAGGGQSQ